MIPDVLISKYLDSELTIDEDVEFRAMLAADPEAREAFDTAVLLHIAMRCEDDTTVPADVEQRVLAFIDSAPMYARSSSSYAQSSSMHAQSVTNSRDSLSTSVKGLRARGAGTFGASAPARGSAHSAAHRMMAVAALLLVLALPLGNQFLSHGDGLAQAVRTAVRSDGPATSASNGTPARNNARMIDAPRISEATHSIGTSIMAEPLVANNASDSRAAQVDVVDVAADQRGQTVQPSLYSLFSVADIPVLVDVRGAAAKPALLSADAPSIDVLVSTSFSQSVSSPTAGAVTTVAAGIGYAVTANTFVGMELGSTQYTRTNETFGLVNDNGASVIAIVPTTTSARTDESGQLAKVTVESNTSPRYRTEVHTTLNPEGTLWGAAFVQHSVLKTGILSVNGRLGAGVGEDGMLTYGRMQAECNLFSGVSLTVGAEARYSPFRTGVVGGQPMARAYGTVISALYGLQVRL